MDFRLYGSRNLQYSLVDSAAFPGRPLRRRHRHRAQPADADDPFYEIGENAYQGLFGDTPRPDEDLTAYGASLSIELGRNLGFSVGARQTEFDSPDFLFDREFREITAAGLSFGGIPRGW